MKKMVSKDTIIATMTDLVNSLNETNPSSEFTNFLADSLATIKSSNGVAFTGQLQYFFNRAPVVKFSDNITFTPEEEKLYHKLLSLNELGNNLWGASL
ncbi:hypothetical protein HMPREF5175_01623 [Lactobacillus gasseri SV-16A-US]|uniref:Bacteriocin immunity protein n=5 Tax=Lactobacillus TaxID=1578 RepID=A0A805ZAA0_LACGA|nr:hypothetical protein LGAS_1824 [Lactobacillus gasseri ATCC 33323 = JCM 1131]EFQ47121.1 hypothetical protein LBGG_01371 [Lactobacillus gasseri MV-22]EJN53321.1 Hypothetical protein A131_80982 [Lactobacillus gasseri CECT 5714]KFL95351.1 hypothetical protein HMPREF0516_01440 [Lactobacillus gasseri SJ-9E-US]KFL97145.1 hypothetical protein HMPREF5175_01623 [Lactobacillus gasseri SV-16A-US]